MTDVMPSASRFEPRPGLRRQPVVRRRRVRGRGVDAGRGDVGVGHPPQPRPEPRLHQGEACGEVVAEDEVAVVRSLKPAVQPDAPAAEVPHMDAVAAAVAGDQRVAHKARGGGGELVRLQAVDAVLGAVEVELQDPVEHVLAAVAPGRLGAG